MLPEKLKEYFSFTKKERTGVLVLIFLILVVFILPYLFPSSRNKTDPRAFEQFRREIATLKPQPDNDANYARKENEPPEKTNSATPALFYFDPNTLSSAAWKQLGVKDKTIHTIEHYLSRGGKFKTPEDLGKIYGLPEREYRRLLPYIQIENKAPSLETGHTVEQQDQKIFSGSSGYKKKDPAPVDINTADTTDFIALRGIGSKLANRIINFRQKLGGFYSVDQLAETYGLPDSVFQQIRPFLKIVNDSLVKIDINAADLNTLKQHPYIRWNAANAIVQYRLQHGAFKSPADLQQIAAMDTSILRKLKPYLKIN